MNDHANAYQRFRRLERVRSFPRRCERCDATWLRDDKVSIVELRGGGCMALHERCRRMAQVEANR